MNYISKVADMNMQLQGQRAQVITNRFIHKFNISLSLFISILFFVSTKELNKRLWNG